MKKSVYLDTNVISYRFNFIENDIETLYRHLVTKDWWENESYHYTLFISEMHLEEIYDYEFKNKDKIVNAVSDIEVLEITEEIANIVSVYLKHNLMPQNDPGDAFHLAAASFHKMDYLLTWNCKHLANANKTDKIAMLNARLGLFVPKIITPESLFTERMEKE